MGRPRATGEGKRKREKDPNQPKRPTSAYFYYMAFMRKQKEQQGQSVTKVAEFTKEVSGYWRALSSQERAPFDAQAARDKERYDSAMAIFKGKDVNKPKRPLSAYFIWLAGFRTKNKDKFEHKELLRQAGESWRRLTGEEKKPFEKQAEIAKGQYEAAMRDYTMGKTVAKKPRMDGAGDAPANNGAAAVVEEDDDDEEDYESDE